MKKAVILLSIVFNGLLRWKKNLLNDKNLHLFRCDNHQIEIIRTKGQKEVELGVLGQGSGVIKDSGTVCASGKKKKEKYWGFPGRK